MPLLKELAAIDWLLSYKHCAPNGASAVERLSRLALSADETSAPNIYVNFLLNASFNPACAWSCAS